MSWNLRVVLAGSLFAVASAALAASIGYVPASFTDDQMVTIRFQHKANVPTGPVWVKLRVFDGATRSAPVIYLDAKPVTFVPGVRMDVDFTPSFPLGRRATGVKLRAEGAIVKRRDQQGSWNSYSVITKQCKKAASGANTNIPINCRWARFSGY